jgi:hypothetical protein
MDVNNLTSVYNQNPTLQSQYTLQQYLDMFGGSSTGTTGTTAQTQTTTPANQGIIGSNINQYQTSGGGDGYNPYSPNTNVNTSYQPNYEYRQHIGGYDPNLSATQNMKMMEVDPNYKGADYYNKPSPTGLAKILDKGINMIPGVNALKTVGNFIGNLLPVNQRGIMENQLRGSGIYTDDIGRLAVGPDGKYNTPEGIMAGYNASQMDPTKENNAWDRRTDTISGSLKDKGLTQAQIDAVISEIAETGQYTGEITDESLGVKNLFSNLVNVNMNKYMFGKTKKKAQDIYDFEVEKKKQAAIEKAAAKSRAESKRQYDPNKHGPNNYGLGSDGKQSYDSGQGFGTNATTGGPVSNKTGKGRTDWAKGGRIRRVRSYFDGGLVSLRRR